ncbi:HalOD1 output domain-containing protein [Halopiger thermotolerans]
MGTTERNQSRNRGETASSQYDWETTTPSQAIVEAVAAIEETTPVALACETGMTLYDYVDPEALDALIGADRTESVEVTFDIDHLRVTVASSGRLAIDVGDQ